MKKVIRLTENDLVRIVKKVISEHIPPANLPWIDIDGNLKSDKEKIVKQNKKSFNLPENPELNQEYLVKVKETLKKAGVGDAEIDLLGAAAGFIPVYETLIDIKTLVDGIIQGNKAKISASSVGLVAPFAGKVAIDLMDYLNKKTFGDEEGEKVSIKRDEIINMTTNERIKLFQKYGHGGYDKWVADGKPKL